jgi:uncharacterized alpha-E superfamily protein
MSATTREGLKSEAREFLSIVDAAEVMHKSRGALAAMRTRGTGPKFLKIGRTILYRASDVAEFLEQAVSTKAESRW